MKTRKIYGSPGTGKTHTLLGIFEEELKTVHPDKIGFVTFTRAARAEVLSRTKLLEDQLPYVRTLHALCYKLMNVRHEDMATAKDIKAFGKKLGVELSGYLPELTSLEIVDGGSRQPTKADRLLQLNHLGRHRGLKLKDTLRDAPLELDFNYAKWFTQAYSEWKYNEGKYDYTDLLTRYLEHGPILDIDVLFVDEGQDLSWLQWAVVRKLSVNVKRQFLSGDDDQCSVSGERVLVSNGQCGAIKQENYWVTIDELDPNKHRIVPYIQGGGFIGSKKFQKANRYYKGQIIRVSTSEKSSCSTLDHRWIVKWTPEAFYKYVTYLMRRGSWFRIGHCRLRREDKTGEFYTNANGLMVRMRKEKADDAWILKVHNTKKEAILYEAQSFVNYAIPGLCFETGRTEWLHEFYNTTKIPIERVIKCLEDHNRSLDFPFWSIENYTKSGGNSSWKCRGYNLISDIMMVPTHQEGTTKHKYENISVTREPYEGLVYSLNVEDHHTYCVNGIATSNCIYTWAGASAELFNTEHADEIVVLPQSYRIPSSVHELSQRIISRVKLRQPKEFKPRDSHGLVKPAGLLSNDLLQGPGSTLVLFRNHHRGQELSRIVEELGIPFIGNYSPLSKSDVQLALSGWHKATTDEIITLPEAKSLVSFAMDQYLQPGARQRANSRTGEFKASSFFTNDALTKPWHQVIPRLPGMRFIDRAITRYGWENTLNPKVSLISIHQSKGREADTVVLDLEMANRTYQAYLKEPEHEHRTYYVAVTRARERLFTLMPTDPKAYQL